MANELIPLDAISGEGRMLQEYSEQLSKIIEQKRLKKKLEQDLSAVIAELTKKSDRFESLTAQLNKEKVDVEKLEQMSLTALFYSILGSREQQLEKERQELLSAQLLYQQTKREVESLAQEQDNILKQLEGLQPVDFEYEKLIAKKEELLRQSNQTVSKELIDLTEQTANLNSEEKEITEALIAGNDVILGLDRVIESLKSAANWGTWDLLGGGLITTVIKHSKIDDAKSSLNYIQIKMSQFKRELADVKKNVSIQIDIGKFESFADLFLDNLITDWIVQSKINNSLEQSQKAKYVIGQALTELNGLKKIAQSKISDLQNKRTQLIEQA
jgi:hypothetical protein